MNTLQNYKSLVKKSISKPFIPRPSFQIHQSILDNFIYIANQEIEKHNELNSSCKRQKLTEAHRSMLQTIYHEAVDQYQLRLSLFDNTELSPLPHAIGQPVRINTNNKDLAYRLSRSNPRAASTIYRRLTRLIECGAIVGKINHGPTANYDLYIHPEIILLWDKDDPDYVPESRYLNGKIAVVYDGQKAKCKPSKETISFRKNKKTIAVHSPAVNNSASQITESPDNPEIVPLHNPQKTLLKTPEAGVAGKDKPQNQNSAEAPQKDTRPGGGGSGSDAGLESSRQRALHAAEYLYKYAVWLLWGANPDQDNECLPQHLRTLYGGNLWNGKKIHRPEEKQTIQYLASQYFCNDTTVTGLERQIRNMQSRLQTASEYLNRQDYYRNGQWFVTPSMFFDQNNKNGFIGTYRWITQAQEWKERKQKESSHRKKLLKSIDRFLSNPTLEEYTRQLTHIRRTVPDLENEFVQRISNTPIGKPVTRNQARDPFQKLLLQMKEYRLNKQPFVIINS